MLNTAFAVTRNIGNVIGTNLNIHEEDVYRELQKWKRCSSP